MVNLFPFPLNQENSGDIKLSTNSKGNNMFPRMKEVPVHFRSPSPNVKVFKFSDLKKATRCFSPDSILGKGVFGDVFLGWVEENTLAPLIQGVGMAVAVKRTQGDAKWQVKLNLLGHLAHPNIIRLLGYCKDELEHLLVYEYMPNKTFDLFLFSDIAEPLSWGTRLSIMIGVARGLAYLHSKNIIHHDVKPSNILLNEDFDAKLGGFWLATGLETWETTVTTQIAGTIGYLAPEYAMTGHLTTKCDIYSLGVVLLESITGRKAMDFLMLEEEVSLVEWATRVGSNIKKIMDPRLEGKYPLHGASKYVGLASRCVAVDPKDRPSGEEILQNLRQIYALNYNR
ncbi:hypothetical protein E3N88_22910 [Mikania micrantha]|uniref:Protein kinase domain-containing protein n=1 Tax=Mikania micrantha TaxID=192012 RepID=A0A5N6NCU9_9ASTR|nr:hypothetical protein E3N88_22910 [Mikania micrantha]